MKGLRNMVILIYIPNLEVASQISGIWLKCFQILMWSRIWNLTVVTLIYQLGLNTACREMQGDLNLLWKNTWYPW